VLAKAPGERPDGADRLGRTLQVTVSTDRADSTDGQHLELPVEQLLRRARPLPPRNEMVIEDLTEEEGAGFAGVYPISGPTLRARGWLPPPVHPELGP
jgi:hypothetical protein